nr:hypothetical protein [Aromatoleum bremense]
MSSGELEAVAVGHPGVFEAALIALPGTQQRSRRLLVVLRRSSCEVSREELLDYLAQRLDRRWLPDDVAFVEHIPHTATGKVRKGQLREMFAAHPWPAEIAAPVV